MWPNTKRSDNYRTPRQPDNDVPKRGQCGPLPKMDQPEPTRQTPVVFIQVIHIHL